MDKYEENHNTYINDPNYPVIAAKAKKKGFRKATASEVRSSANNQPWAIELYSAYGGLWVRQFGP
ncbi:MAG: hypothetical protein ACXWT4_06080 [Methylobacter sp.]